MITTPLTTTPRCLPRRAFTALVAITAFTLTSCGTGPENTPELKTLTSNGTVTSTVTETSTPESRESTNATGTPRADAGLTPLGDADITMKTLRPEPAAQLVVTGVRLGTHEGFDRVVFDFAGNGSPGWFINYTDRPTQQGSGFPIEFLGDTALEVNIDGTTYAFALDMEEPQLGEVTGPGPIVAGVSSAGAFEGRTQFVIGVNGGKRPYSAQVLTNPTRLVIDILQG
ncbi:MULTISPECIES: hypothetical protein [unclassified Corynebacterium]|uniref:AMIN-like domain-containing (lipo)protein n=1 Tax=unclassified Corynebacterium TaxID=2624378 RepID=UPI003525567E